MEFEAIETPTAAAAVGPYSQAVRVGNILYLSGQLPMVPGVRWMHKPILFGCGLPQQSVLTQLCAQEDKLVSGDAAAQAHQCMRNIAAILAATGSSFSQVAKTNVRLVDMDHYDQVNAVYGAFICC